jgi:hypothetical protein
MAKADQLDDLLVNASELETFLHTFLGKLDPKKLKANEDLTPYVKQSGLRLPPALKGASITWEGSGESHMAVPGGDAQTLVFAHQGHPDAIGLVIKCVKVGKWSVCLECGWIWCRIVVTRRF